VEELGNEATADVSTAEVNGLEYQVSKQCVCIG
jgi:hypothetical protein